MWIVAFWHLLYVLVPAILLYYKVFNWVSSLCWNNVLTWTVAFLGNQYRIFVQWFENNEMLKWDSETGWKLYIFSSSLQMWRNVSSPSHSHSQLSIFRSSFKCPEWQSCKTCRDHCTDSIVGELIFQSSKQCTPHL